MKLPGSPSPLELDALAETGNIGMGHAAAALAALMGREVRIEVPSLAFLDPMRPTPPFGSEEGIGLSLEISGGVCAALLILLPVSHARQILGTTAGNPAATEPLFGDAEAATLTARGLALAAAYLEALGLFLKLPLSPSRPLLEHAPAHAIVEGVLQRCQEHAPPLMIQTLFSVPGVEGCGRMLLIPGSDGVDAILRALGTR